MEKEGIDSSNREIPRGKRIKRHREGGTHTAHLGATPLKKGLGQRKDA